MYGGRVFLNKDNFDNEIVRHRCDVAYESKLYICIHNIRKLMITYNVINIINAKRRTLITDTRNYLHFLTF